MLDRILCRQHQKRIRKRVRVVVHCDLCFVHRFQQGRLCFRRRPVDFVGDDDVRENWTGPEFEFFGHWTENAHSDHVARQQIRRELDPLKRTPERPRQRMRQRRFSHSRHVFNQQMTAREQRRQREFDYLVLALHYLRNRADQLGKPAAGVHRRGLQFPRPSATNLTSRATSSVG